MSNLPSSSAEHRSDVVNAYHPYNEEDKDEREFALLQREYAKKELIDTVARGDIIELVTALDDIEKLDAISSFYLARAIYLEVEDKEARIALMLFMLKISDDNPDEDELVDALNQISQREALIADIERQAKAIYEEGLSATDNYDYTTAEYCVYILPDGQRKEDLRHRLNLSYYNLAVFLARRNKIQDSLNLLERLSHNDNKLFVDCVQNIREANPDFPLPELPSE